MLGWIFDAQIVGGEIWVSQFEDRSAQRSHVTV